MSLFIKFLSKLIFDLITWLIPWLAKGGNEYETKIDSDRPVNRDADLDEWVRKRKAGKP